MHVRLEKIYHHRFRKTPCPPNLSLDFPNRLSERKFRAIKIPSLAAEDPRKASKMANRARHAGRRWYIIVISYGMHHLCLFSCLKQQSLALSSSLSLFSLLCFCSNHFAMSSHMPISTRIQNDTVWSYLSTLWYLTNLSFDII